MIKSIIVTNYLGEELELELTRPDDSGFAVESVDGLGPGNATINITEISTSDGGKYNSSRVSSRNIVLHLKYMWVPTIEDARQKSYRFFPLKKDVRLRVITDNRDVYIDGYVESNEPDIFSETSGATISIICPNPYFYKYGPEGDQSTVFSTVLPAFEFPFSNESLSEKLLVMSTYVHNSETNVIYNGDVPIGMTIYAHALDNGIGDITIFNVDTRGRIIITTSKLPGGQMLIGDDILINTFRGEKSAYLRRNGEFYNVLNSLNLDMEWFTLAQGDNIFAYNATDREERLDLRIINRIAYWGI